LTLAFIFPLFWVAIKCRDPRTRRRAVSLLYLIRHQEGPWTSIAAAKAAELVISIEEEGLPEGSQRHQIPELKRVHLVHTVADAEKWHYLPKLLDEEKSDWEFMVYKRFKVFVPRGPAASTTGEGYWVMRNECRGNSITRTRGYQRIMISFQISYSS
jgi:hypothetical protein